MLTVKSAPTLRSKKGWMAHLYSNSSGLLTFELLFKCADIWDNSIIAWKLQDALEDRFRGTNQF